MKTEATSVSDKIKMEKYTIIANDCFGGYYCQLRNIKNDNPFIFGALNLSNFIKLIKNFWQ